MEKDILKQVEVIFREVFGESHVDIDRTTTATDIEEWDSLTHIEMIVAVEKHFRIKFKSLDLEKLNNVGDLSDLIEKKLAAGC